MALIALGLSAAAIELLDSTEAIAESTFVCQSSRAYEK